MATVSTVLGPVNTSELGFTLCHEHIAVGAAGMRHTYPEFFDREGTIEDAVAALKQAYDEGVRSYIDPTTFDLGRDIAMPDGVSRRPEVQVLLTNGTHSYFGQNSQWRRDERN